MLLHKDREQFVAIVNAVSNELSIPIPIVEKDYYVTMILKQLSLHAKNCVFKGGTSLSKCHHAIDRFSEDIDITFSDTLSQGERQKLKNNTIDGISKYLGVPIPNWDDTHSRRDYNCYYFKYEPIEGFVPERLSEGVKMEVVFALCDYYLKGDINKHSRHIYDLYMLMPKMTFDQDFKKLIEDVRIERRKKPERCPSSLDGVNIDDMLEKIVDEAVYEKDYETITSYFQKTRIEYDTAIEAVKKIIELHIF